jgi:hypothetical protein
MALRADRFVATAGEARLAAAAFAARGADLGGVALPAADSFAVRQIAVVATLLPIGGASVVDGARFAALALGFVSVLLLWPVLRQLGAGPVPSAVAAGLVGVVPPIVALHAAITAAAPATVWLVLAGALIALARKQVVAAAVAAGIAVLTAPLAAACLLALAAHLLHERVVGPRLPARLRLPAVVVTALAAVGVAAAAAGNGPLAGVGGPVVGLGVTILLVGAGFVLAGLTWVQHPELRPALSPAVLLLAVAVVPGAARSAALLLALPFVAMIFAVLAEPVAAALPESRQTLAAAVPLTALALALVVGLLAVVNVRPQPPVSLAAWASSELGPGAIVHADPLDRAELLSGGVAPERLRDLDGPVRAGDLVMVTDRPTTGARTSRVPRCAAISTLASVPRGAGGSPTAVCPGNPVAPATAAAEQAGRARFGSALARNPSLQLEPPAAAALEAGIVDPRIVLVLADLASPRKLAIADFPVAPFEPPYALRRRVVLTAVDGMPASGDPQPLIRTWFSSQQPPFVPSTIETDGPDLVIAYPAPTPTGLLAG